MSENTTTSNIDTMKYNDLKALAAEKGLDSSGTKEDLIARLKDAGVGGNTNAASDEGSNDGDKSDENAGNHQPAPQSRPLNQSQERAEDTKAERALRQSALEMKKALEKQPKVSIMIPFEVGENPENGKKVPFHVNLNGYAIDYPRGQYIEVPQQVADLIKERLESEGKIGAQWRIDRDQNKATALS